LGPFTFAWSDHYRTIAISAQSGDEDERKAYFRLSLGCVSFLAALPTWLIRPEKKRVQAKYWSAQDIERMGRDWYWEAIPREYGFSISDGHLSVHYGRVTGDSSTEQCWGCFLPWTQWRHVRHSFYGLQGEILYDEESGYRLGDGANGNWEARRAREAAVPTAAFTIKDFDGEELTATTKIEEREWRFGTGYFKWLSLFRRPKIRRSLDISFSGETGPEKGSWKGGTTGTGIDMLPNELHEAAFRRYCDEEHRSKYRKYSVKFVGIAEHP
jgi:hypothetical protein